MDYQPANKIVLSRPWHLDGSSNFLDSKFNGHMTDPRLLTVRLSLSDRSLYPSLILGLFEITFAVRKADLCD